MRKILLDLILIIHQIYNLGDDFTLAPLQPSFVPSQTEKEPETFQPLGKQTNGEIKKIYSFSWRKYLQINEYHLHS